jgi:hypothetical protein
LRINTKSAPDGSQMLFARAQDAAGNWGSQALQVSIDNTTPGPPLDLVLSGGDGWRQRNRFSVTWRNPSQEGVAPIARAMLAVCPSSNDPEKWDGCSATEQIKPNITTVDDFEVPSAGAWVARVWLGDAAGNQDRRTAQAVPLRLDDRPPDVRFRGTDVADPTRIDVLAADSTSPITRTELEIRRRGDASWLPLATTRTSDGVSARIDDENLPNGIYDLRARAYDSAGNEQSADRDTSGTPATRAVPTRIDTRLVAGQVKLVKARGSRGGKRRTRRVIVVRPRVDYGRTVPIQGRLTMPGGNPVPNGIIEVWERISVPATQFRRVAVIGTDAAGRFTFKALRGPSRMLRFRYAGTALVRARTAEVKLQVNAATTLESSRRRVVNGDEIVLRGRVQGRPLPTVGKLVQLQAYSRGRWLTFATPRADAATGRWSYRYRFTATRGTVRYRFRASIPEESTYPYGRGASRSVFVLVRGL